MQDLKIEKLNRGLQDMNRRVRLSEADSPLKKGGRGITKKKYRIMYR